MFVWLKMPVEFLSGEQCYLRPLRREDLNGPWADWLNDPEVTRHMMQGAFPTTMEANEAFYESVATSRSDLVLAIMQRHAGSPSETHVGNVGLHRIDWVNRVAEFGILIGEKTVWGHGIGREATRLICQHGFERLNLQRIFLGVIADHVGAIKCYARVGFRIEGACRKEIIRGDKRIDKVIMGLLPDELI